MATKHTVEEHILKLLYEKIHLFEKVVGDLDDILTKSRSAIFEDHLHDILFYSATDEEMKIKMENLTSFISYGNEAVSNQEQIGG